MARIPPPPAIKAFALPNGPLWFWGASNQLATFVDIGSLHREQNRITVNLVLRWSPEIMIGDTRTTTAVFGGIFDCAQETYRQAGAQIFDHDDDLQLWLPAEQPAQASKERYAPIREALCRDAQPTAAFVFKDRREAAEFAVAVVAERVSGQSVAVEARQILDADALFRTLKSKAPDEYETAVKALASEPRAMMGGSDGERLLQEVGVQTLKRLYQRVDDTSAVAFGQVQKKMLQALQQSAPGLCDAMLDNAPIDPAEFEKLWPAVEAANAAANGEFAGILAKATLSAPEETHGKASAEDVMKLARKALATLPAEDQSTLPPFLRDRSNPRPPPGAVCRFVAALVADMATEPTEKAAALLRANFTPAPSARP